MFGHVMLGTNDLDTSMVFYDETMPVLGYTRVETGDGYAQYGRPEDVGTGLNCLFVGRPLDQKPASPGNGVNIALLAQTRQQVIDFHRIALQHGGQDEGEPGLRDVHPSFFAAYVRDPAGNKLVIVCHH